MNENTKKVYVERDILFTTTKHQNYLLEQFISSNEKNNNYGFAREEEYRTKNKSA